MYMITENLQISLSLKYEMEEKDGKAHVALKSYSFKFNVKDGAAFDLTNLFNGNKELSKYNLFKYLFILLIVIMLL